MNKNKPTTRPARTATQSSRSLKRVVRRLGAGIVKEAIQKGWADINDPAWNPNAHVELTLTVADVRLAALLCGYKPTRRELTSAQGVEAWNDYLDELDGVE